MPTMFDGPARAIKPPGPDSLSARCPRYLEAVVPVLRRGGCTLRPGGLASGSSGGRLRRWRG